MSNEVYDELLELYHHGIQGQKWGCSKVSESGWVFNRGWKEAISRNVQ